jgi:hypothetical protein
MSKYSLYSPVPSFRDSAVFGGGGGGSSAPAPAPAPVYTSSFPELRGKTYSSMSQKNSAEASVLETRKKAEEARKAEEAAVKAAEEQRQKTQALQNKALSDPSSLVTKAQVAQIDPNTQGTSIDPSTGQLTSAAPQITGAAPTQAATITAAQSQDAIQQATDNLVAAQGQVSPEAQVVAQTTDPTQIAQLGLGVSQIDQAQTVQAPDARTVQEGEMISGPSVDMGRVDEAVTFDAAQADPTAQATVQGQLEGLMQQFEGGDTPAWASGALRNATAVMAARGLGASSMAGQALVQAAMESALPIAMQDAQTVSTFELQNLSNRQQTSMFAAQQRAKFLEIEFNQDFQTRVANAAKIGDIANMNFSAEQQIALENAQLAQTVDLANLNAVNAKVMADAAAMTQVELTNLNNRQKAAVQNANAFLQMDMKNLDLQQQTAMFKAQANISSIMSDTAAENAARQFNASSENQTNQFFANMALQTQQFNAGMDVQRDQFNAQNALVVAQANAQWRQNVATLNTSAQNEANRQDALAANNFTQSTMDQIWQRERDLMDYAFRQSESSQDRSLQVFLAGKAENLTKWNSAQADSRADKQGKGYMFSRLLFG